MMQRNYMDRIGDEDRVTGVLDDGSGPQPVYATELCHHPNGNTVIGHNVASDGVCTDCGKRFKDFDPFRPGDAFCAEVAGRIGHVTATWNCYGEFNQCVSVYPDGDSEGRVYWFGTANCTWGADVYANGKAQEQGVIATSLDTGVSQSERDVKVVAMAIMNAVRRYETSREFLVKLEAFKTAAMELSEAWEKLDPDDSASEKLVKTYPFVGSFDELVLGIIDWRNEVEEDPKFGIKEVK